MRLDAENVIEELAQLKEKHQQMTYESETLVMQLSSELKLYKQKYEDSEQKLSHYTLDLVPKLMHKVDDQRFEIDRLIDEKCILQKNLTMTNAIMRSPQLRDIYIQQERQI